LKTEVCGTLLKAVNVASSQVPYLSYLFPNNYHHFAYSISLDLGVSTDVVMGYYEWLKKGKDKIPHFTKRGDGKIMLLAGLWDSVQYEGPPPGTVYCKTHPRSPHT
jgi:hypothetical protein